MKFYFFQVHTQQRPFECKICCRRYRQNSTLIMHKRTAHSLVESENGTDIYIKTTSDLNDSTTQSVSLKNCFNFALI